MCKAEHLIGSKLKNEACLEVLAVLGFNLEGYIIDQENKNTRKYTERCTSGVMGVDKPNSLMKSMAAKGGHGSQRLTNHSARKRMIEKLNDTDFPSYQVWIKYRHLPTTAKNMSTILSTTEPSVKAPPTPNETLASGSEAQTLSCSFQQSRRPAMPGASALSGAVFYGGNHKHS